MGFAIDMARVIPMTRVPTIKLPEGVTDLASRLAAGRIELPPRNPADEALGPAASGNPSSDTDVTQLRAEFKVDGKVIARVYNSGQTEFAGGYGHLSNALAKRMVGTESKVGPERADAEIDALTDLLKASPEGSTTGGTGASDNPRMKYMDCVVARTTTALTQDQWLAIKAQTPGSIVSIEA
ncbi:hypothetical protein RA307_00670 [Xanthobacteraceae bacterium Astr-EGSB]|uniref:hypothetical protein n=1 Tax=Astrobacterium formosum TaxID=3069710 RepID=UPI0027B0A523|nr:hypothetical protein [Xanthobacteraceae bacterium Astr-EGSB]